MRALAVLLLAIAPGVGATTYVVAAANGSDDNPGTEAEPWATLQKAAATVVAGDTVEIRAGNYAGMNLELKSGAPGTPITFRNFAGEEPVVDAEGPQANVAINVDSCSHVVIEGLRVAAASNYGFRVVGGGFVTLRGNVVQGALRSGVFAGVVDDLLVEDNLVVDSVEDAGVQLSTEGDRVVVRRNVLLGNAGGIRFTAESGLGETGLFRDSLVEANRVKPKDGTPAAALTLGGFQNGAVRNNLFYDVPRAGIVVWKDVAAGASTGNLFVHNTVVLTDTGDWAMYLLEGSTGNVLRNNVLYNANTSTSFGTLLAGNDSLTGLDSDRNAVVDRFGTTDGMVDTVLSLAQWRSQTGQDLSSILADAQDLFVSPDTDDYRLRAGSPAIDTGESRIEVTDDIDGLPRPEGNGWDIGAYEFRDRVFADGFED
jgi:hypothetical protein